MRVNYSSYKCGFFAFLFLIVCSVSSIAKNIYVCTPGEVYQQINALLPGDSMILNDGDYKDLQLVVTVFGSKLKPITIAAKNPGQVFFIGDAKVALRGLYIVLSGISFERGNRDVDVWKSHGPGLVAIYGSYNRVTNCRFDNFDEANSAWITTSLSESGEVPTHCRIDHCSFTNKLTFDQVINLNNTFKKDTIGGPAMYHRIDHCFFSNPKKKGNAGGGIRVGYYRNDTGRCVIDSNIFIRQDSEAEIITSKSRENIYYFNTFINCQGTLNFRHGDKQVAINNFFIGNDSLFEYGGMYVWGSDHIIGNNYFNLKRTIKSRGNAAVYLNAGTKASEHALAYNIQFIKNVFVNVNGYAIHFNPMLENRKAFASELQQPLELPHHIQLIDNVFFNNKYFAYSFFKIDSIASNRYINWEHCIYSGSGTGIAPAAGLVAQSIRWKETDRDFELPQLRQRTNVVNLLYDGIEGIDFSIKEKIKQGIEGSPLHIRDVMPNWMFPANGSYYQTGKLPVELKQRLAKITNRNQSL